MATVTDSVISLQKTYSDIDFNFSQNPGTGDVSKKTNIEAVKQSVKNLLLTKMYERPFQPNLYSQLYDLLFEPFTATTKYALEKVISNVLTNYEPRIIINELNVVDRKENNALDIILNFTVIALQISTTYSIQIDRIR